MSLKRQMLKEINLINRCLADHKVDAGTAPAWTLVAASSFIAYGIRLGRGERIANVEKTLPELAELISAERHRATPIRLRTMPLALEVPHPAPRPLSWQTADIDTEPHSMLLGRSYTYQGPREELLRFDEQPHALIAGMTGAGKSVLLSMMLLTLLRNTSPDELRVVLVDLKNEDLVPFARLPHVVTFAGERKAARAAINFVHTVKDERIASRQRPFRLVLAVDELAELANVDGSLDQMGSILSVGRTLGVNVLAATQHPLAKVVGGIAKANFPVRLAGMVIDANAANVATGRPGTGAEMLPGRGAFLRIQSADVVRLQSYFIDEGDIAGMTREIRRRWDGHERAAVEVKPVTPEAVDADDNTVEQLAERIRPLWEDGASLAAMIRELFGEDANTGGSNRNWTLRAVRWLEDDATTTTGDKAPAPEEKRPVALLGGSSSSARPGVWM